MSTSKRDVIKYLRKCGKAGVGDLLKKCGVGHKQLDNMVRNGILEASKIPYKLGGRYKLDGKPYTRQFSLRGV